MADLIIGENNNLVRQDIITSNTGYNVSERYVPISTESVFDIIREIEPKAQITGWLNSNVQKKEKEGHQKHAMMIRMPGSEIIPGIHSNIVLFNSSDRSSALKLYEGAFRAVCSNGIVFSDTGENMNEISIRHTKKDWQESIYTLMQQYQENQAHTKAMIENMMNKYTSYGDMGRFAERVVAEIVDPMIVGSVIDPMQLLVSQRTEDLSKDVWTTYNKVQEYVMKGGVERIIEKTDEEGILFSTTSKTHKISDPQKQIKVNRQLHEMALEML